MYTPTDASPDEPAETRDAVVRDDSADLPALLDLARARRRSGGRVTVIDSGKFGAADLERLGEAGLDIATSDTVRADAHALILAGLAASKGGAAAAVFIHGPLHAAESVSALSFEALLDLGRSGLRLSPRFISASGKVCNPCRGS